jgi:hypothetical protein
MVSSDPVIGSGSGESIDSRSRFLDSGDGEGVVRIVVAGLGRVSLPLHRPPLLTDAVVADSIFGEPSVDDDAELGARGEVQSNSANHISGACKNLGLIKSATEILSTR